MSCFFCGADTVAIPAMGRKGDAGIGLCASCAKELETQVGVTLTRPEEPPPADDKEEVTP